jgi:hypothetical protein
MSCSRCLVEPLLGAVYINLFHAGLDWLDEITTDCPKKIERDMNDPCGAKCPQCRWCFRALADQNVAPLASFFGHHRTHMN